MKGKELEGHVFGLERRLQDIEQKVWGLEAKAWVDVEIRSCKKCGHDTLQQKGAPSYYRKGKEPYYGMEYDFKCLTCGTKWNCRAETVCEEVDKPKNKPKK